MPLPHRQSPQTGKGLPSQSAALLSAKSQPPQSEQAGKIEHLHALAKGGKLGVAPDVCQVLHADIAYDVALDQLFAPVDVAAVGVHQRDAGAGAAIGGDGQRSLWHRALLARRLASNDRSLHAPFQLDKQGFRAHNSAIARPAPQADCPCRCRARSRRLGQSGCGPACGVCAPLDAATDALHREGVLVQWRLVNACGLV